MPCTYYLLPTTNIEYGMSNIVLPAKFDIQRSGYSKFELRCRLYCVIKLQSEAGGSAVGSHLFPSRTQKLSPLASMVLGPNPVLEE